MSSTTEICRLSSCPFDNLSADASKDYIADAFTEDLITDLSRIRDAFVISRSTSFTYRGKDVDAASVARDLGVRYVLEGSLSINGATARINARLVDGATNSQLWSDRYERDIAEVFDVQDNVTGRIASVLRAELRKADNERQGPEIEKDAWDYALRGKRSSLQPPERDRLSGSPCPLEQSGLARSGDFLSVERAFLCLLHRELRAHSRADPAGFGAAFARPRRSRRPKPIR